MFAVHHQPINCRSMHLTALAALFVVSKLFRFFFCALFTISKYGIVEQKNVINMRELAWRGSTIYTLNPGIQLNLIALRVGRMENNFIC